MNCPDGLLPDGEVCPRCCGSRAASGVDGGSWVHYPSTTSKSDLNNQAVTESKTQDTSIPRPIPRFTFKVDAKFSAYLRYYQSVGCPVNVSRKEAKARILIDFIEQATTLDELKTALIEYMNRGDW